MLCMEFISFLFSTSPNPSLNLRSLWNSSQLESNPQATQWSLRLFPLLPSHHRTSCRASISRDKEVDCSLGTIYAGSFKDTWEQNDKCGYGRAYESLEELLKTGLQSCLSPLVSHLSAFYTVRMVWVFPYDRALEGVNKTPLFPH